MPFRGGEKKWRNLPQHGSDSCPTIGITQFQRIFPETREPLLAQRVLRTLSLDKDLHVFMLPSQLPPSTIPFRRPQMLSPFKLSWYSYASRRQ